MTEPTYRLIILLCLWAAVIYVLAREIAIIKRERRAKARRAETEEIRVDIRIEAEIEAGLWRQVAPGIYVAVSQREVA